MDQGVALFPENELVTMEMEFCGSAAILDYFIFGAGEGRGGSPKKRDK